MAGVPRFSLGWLYNFITGDEDARVCKDIPDSACRHLPRNFFSYLLANILTKTADELASAKLILPWLLGTLGTPAGFTGFLVPIREAGVLLPQLFVAAYIRRLAIRKTVWIAGAIFSSVIMLLMSVIAMRYTGTAAGWIIIGLTTIFSLIRGLSSVATKDVLGKTVSKTRRGTLMGYSAGVAGVATLALGIYIKFYASYMSGTYLFFWFFVAAGILWLVTTGIIFLIKEEPGATEGGGNAIIVAIQSLAILKNDLSFRHFVLARTMLLSVALVLPFYVLLAQENSSEITGLGLLIIAGGLAGSLSSPFWGHICDYSSRLVMVLAAIGAGITGIITWMLHTISTPVAGSVWIYTLLFFLISLFHSGIRLGRKVYLVDMSSSETRASYVAVSNTVIGAAMLIGGIFGFIADILNTSSVIGLLGLLSLLSAIYIQRLPNISG